MAPREVAWDVIFGRETREFEAMAAARESVPAVSMARMLIGLVVEEAFWSFWGRRFLRPMTRPFRRPPPPTLHSRLRE
jgi:hypothetical protein